MFYFDKFYGKKILKSSLLRDYDCFFTTRDFVLTNANREDLKMDALSNREFLKEKLNCYNLCSAEQIHSDNISKIQDNKIFYEKTDALISNKCGSTMFMNFADCVPVILYSIESAAAAIIHAGWRGTALEIAKKTSKKMQKEFNISPEKIIALIGPSIGKCCFETDENVFNQIVKDKTETELYNEKNGKFYIDLKLINKNQLVNTGIINIDICDYCTCCMSDIFFSYRKEKGYTARHSAVVKIAGG